MQSHLFISYPWQYGLVSNQEDTEGTSNLSKQDVIDILNDESSDNKSEKDEPIVLDLEEDGNSEKKEKELKAQKDEDEEDEEESDEDSDDDDEDEKPIGDEEEDRELELVVPVSKKQILKKYPKLFEDFPHLEQAYYAEQQYTELFGTLDDAKEVVEKAKILDNVEEELRSGSAEGVLKTIKEQDKEGFNKLVDNYMENLRSVDENAFYHVVSGMFKSGISQLIKEAKATNNEERRELLEQTALIWNQFFFGKSEFEPHKRLSGEPEKKDDSVKKEREDWNKQRLETAVRELGERVDNSIKSTIDKHIDPKGIMSPYVKKNAVREAVQKINHLISIDKRFQLLKDKGWKEAMGKSLSNDSVDAIRRMYLGRAKALIPQVIKSIQREVLSKTDRQNNNSRSGHNPIRRISASSTREETNRGQHKEVPRGLSTFEFLNKELGD